MKIFGFDYPCADMNLFCEAMPGTGEWTAWKDYSLMGGGKVPNAIITVARLGARTVMLGAVGDDRYGHLCRNEFQEAGVNTDQLLAKPGHTSLCVSIVDEKTHEKHYLESGSSFEPLDAGETVSAVQYIRTHAEPGDYLMLYQMDDRARALAAAMREAGGYVETDGDEYDERTQEALSLVDVFIMSEYYYQRIFPGADIEDQGELRRNLGQLAENGPSILVVTLGARGSAGMDHGSFFTVEPWQVKVMDTTGAGDVFHGAFVFALSEGKRAAEAASFAGAVSAIKCTVLGGRAGIPTKECTEAFMTSGRVPACDFAEREEKYRKAMWENCI